MSPCDLFDRVYVINLDRRTDRWAHISDELKRLNVHTRVTRISGVDSPGATGCFDSHLKTIRAAINDNVRRPLILEDDALFHNDWNTFFEEALEQLPKQWDVLYLGYSFDLMSEEARRATFNSPRVLSFPKGCCTTHAYSINSAALRRLLGDLAEVRAKHFNAHGENLQIDQAYLSLATQYAMYGVYPMAATQRDGYSDIWREHRRYDLQANVDRILRFYGRLPG